MSDMSIDATDAFASPGREAWRMFYRNKAAVLGLVLLVLIILLALFGPVIYDHDPADFIARPNKAPNLDTTDRVPILGSDIVGRDVLAGVMHGGATTLRVALFAVVIIVTLGVGIGSVAGYYGGWVDSLLMRFTEVFQVLPALLFSMVIVTLWAPSTQTISVAIGLVLWPQLARLTRAEFLRIRNLEYVKAARAIGASDLRIMFRVILPNALPPLIVATSLVMGAAILFEAYLAFLGLGEPGSNSWGYWVGENRDVRLTAWWAITFPGLAIFATVLSFSLIGDGLQDAFNPKLRGR